MSVSRFQEYDLDKKVDDFVQDYSREITRRDVGTDIGKFCFPRELRNLIESKAVYAELKWRCVYGYLDKERKQIVEKSRQIFTWEQFNGLILPEFPKLDLTNSDINQQVLHRVIERGGNRVGSRRGALFAQNADLDINVPVSYAIDWSDPDLYDFLESLISQLNLDTICPVNYFSRISEDLENIEEMKLGEVISRSLAKSKNREKMQA